MPVISIDLPRDVRWPTLASVPLASGTDTANWQLLEDGQSIPARIEVVATWPAGSPKWLHVHAVFMGGRRYELAPGPAAPAPAGDFPEFSWTLRALDHRGARTGNGGWRGLRWLRPVQDDHAVELDDPVVRIERFEGWLRAEPPKIASYLRYRTRIVRYAGHPLVRVSHAITFADKMVDNRLQWLAFVRTVEPSGQRSAGVDKVIVDASVTAATSLTRWHQRRHDRLAPSGGRADGWFRAGRTVLFLRDFWQKYPQAVEAENDELRHLSWYGEGREFTEAERLDPRNLHRMLHWHHGRYLDSQAPADWIDACAATGEWFESHPEYAAAADMQGITIHDDLAFADDVAEPELMNAVWQADPVGYVSGSHAASTGLVDLAEVGTDYPETEQFLEDALLGWTNPQRHQDYGRFLWGQAHRHHNLGEDRPTLHRVGLVSYYCFGETLWRQRLRGGSAQILQLARRTTEYYRSIVQTSYDRLRGYHLADDSLRQNVPETKFHQQGGFWQRGHWWGPDFGMLTEDDWQQLFGRSPDPDALLWSWLMDGNRYHKDGWDLWFETVHDRLPITGTKREANKTLGYAVTAYEYTEDPQLLVVIKGLANSLQSEPLDVQHPGPLWNPEWCRRALPYDATLEDYVRVNYEPRPIGDTQPYDLAAMRYDVTSDEAFLREHLAPIQRLRKRIYRGADQRWQGWGVGVGPLGDAFFTMQWPAFKKRLRTAGLTEANWPDDPECGFYPSGISLETREQALSNGTEILILKEGPGPLELFIDAPHIGLTGGDIHATSLLVLAPSGAELLFETRIDQALRSPALPVQWRNGLTYKRLERSLPTNEIGLFRAVFGSFAFPLYQRLTSDLPEAMLFKPVKPTGDGAAYWWKNARGLLRGLDSATTKVSVESQAGPNQSGGFVRVNGADLLYREQMEFDVGSTLPIEIVAQNNGIARVTVSTPALFGSDPDALDRISSEIAV